MKISQLVLRNFSSASTEISVGKQISIPLTHVLIGVPSDLLYIICAYCGWFSARALHTASKILWSHSTTWVSQRFVALQSTAALVGCADTPCAKWDSLTSVLWRHWTRLATQPFMSLQSRVGLLGCAGMDCVDRDRLASSTASAGDRIFSQQQGAHDVEELRACILAVVEHGQRHHGHGVRRPGERIRGCRRQGKQSAQIRPAGDCRYLFPCTLFPLNEEDMETMGKVHDDPHHLELRNRRLRRNDALLNIFEEHIRLASLAEIDWGTVLKLWSVLDFLIRYVSKRGEAARNPGIVFAAVLKNVCDYGEDVLNDL